MVITGSHLSGATAVSFGGTPAASFTVNSTSQITAVSPLHSAAGVSISVTGPGGTSANTLGGRLPFRRGARDLGGDPRERSERRRH